MARGEALDALERLNLLLASLSEIAPATVADRGREAGEIAKSLPREERIHTIVAMVGLAYHTIDGDVSHALLERLMMANSARELIDNAIGEGPQRGEAEGLSKGRTETEKHRQPTTSYWPCSGQLVMQTNGSALGLGRIAG